MSRPYMWFGIGGIILGLILFIAAVPWYVPLLVIAAAIAVPVVAWAALGSSNRRRIIEMRRRGRLGP